MGWVCQLSVLGCVLVVGLVNSQQANDVVSTSNPCVGVESCGKCIATSPRCGWCGSAEYAKKGNKYRCDLLSNLKASGCPDAEISNPDNVKTEIENKKVQDGTGVGDAIQIQPQSLNIQLRPNTPETFKLTFRLAENYPVDLYYLMDLSNSMEDDKEKLAALGNKIADSMSNITKNFRLGFGSFVDKVVMPYVSTVPKKLQSPCTGCEAPYSFKNQLSLDTETEKFEQYVRAARVSGNLDAPEGGFDAIMQSVMCKNEIGWRNVSRKLLLFSTDADFHFAGDGKVCPMTGQSRGLSARHSLQPPGMTDLLYTTPGPNFIKGLTLKMLNQIGWRDQSRKMLLFSTDAGFHFAGDGKLGGIVKPNDGQCHMTNNIYTEGENQDYPSVSQIATKIREKSVNVIFAVTEDKLPVYDKLSKYIEGSEATKLANDSSNIVEVIKKNYQRITSKVQMNTQYAENITVKFTSSCKTGGAQEETNVCDNLSIGDVVTFDVTVSVDKCPAEASGRIRAFSIYPVGLAEKLDITLDLICECECEKPGQAGREPSSPQCNGQGTFECGQCTCDPGRYGKKCECDGSQSTSDESLANCMNPNSTSNVPCSGRGECICGVCECHARRLHTTEKYSGDYCHCDDYSCSFHNLKMCGGHGTCDCGVCDCEPGYTGDACECSNSTDSCMTNSGKLCNGVGDCECGACKCWTNSSYKGPTCEECPTCPGKCTENKNCALCVGFQSGPLADGRCDEECKHVTAVQNIDEEEVKADDKLHMCQFQDDEDDCRYFFTYRYVQNNDVEVKVQMTKVCPESVNILAIVFGVIGGIVIIGLILLLIWKLFTTIHDRREFAKFEKETQNAKWDTGENPIYQQATSTFKNPTYAGRN